MFRATSPSCTLPGQAQVSSFAPSRRVCSSLSRRYRTRGSTQETATEGSESNMAPKVCQTCGISLNEAPRGCDNQGRIGGGLGAVVGFDWWPIKAYRPCPAASKAGIAYNRKGQITDEMLFGRGTGGNNK